MNDKKKFIIPEAMLVTFTTDDIITASVWEDGGNDNGEPWGPEIPDGEGDF